MDIWGTHRICALVLIKLGHVPQGFPSSQNEEMGMCHRSPRVAVECLALLCQLASSATWFGAVSLTVEYYGCMDVSIGSTAMLIGFFSSLVFRCVLRGARG